MGELSPERDNEQQKCNLLRNFYGLTYEKGIEIATYISKLRNFAYRLKAMEIEINDTMIISKVLATLSEEYAHFVSAWNSTDTTGKTLEKLNSKINCRGNENWS